MKDNWIITANLPYLEVKDTLYVAKGNGVYRWTSDITKAKIFSSFDGAHNYYMNNELTYGVIFVEVRALRKRPDKVENKVNAL